MLAHVEHDAKQAAECTQAAKRPELVADDQAVVSQVHLLNAVAKFVFEFAVQRNKNFLATIFQQIAAPFLCFFRLTTALGKCDSQEATNLEAELEAVRQVWMDALAWGHLMYIQLGPYRVA